MTQDQDEPPPIHRVAVGVDVADTVAGLTQVATSQDRLSALAGYVGGTQVELDLQEPPGDE